MRDEEIYFNEILDKVGDHLKTRQEYVKLVLVEKSSKAMASVMSSAIIFTFFMLFFVFINLSLAYYISVYTDKTYLGFGVVGLVYLLAGIICYVKRDQWLNIPIRNSIIKSTLKEGAYEEN